MVSGFPRGSVVKNPSAEAGGVGSVPALGRSLIHGAMGPLPQILSLCSGAWEPQREESP